MTPRNFAMVFGIVYLLVGILGFVPGLLRAPPVGAPDLAIDSFYGYLLGLFPVNVLHSVVHALIGVWGIVAARSMAGSITYGKGVAVIYGLLTILGLIPGTNTLFGLVPLHGHDIWLHAVSAAIAAYFGFMWRPASTTAHAGPR